MTEAGSVSGGAEDRERDLLRRLKSGEELAFERLVRDQGGRLLAVARRFLRDEEEARDAVQEGFLSAWRALDRFDQGSRLSTWLHRIVVNACLMRLRTRRRRPEDNRLDLKRLYLCPLAASRLWLRFCSLLDRRRRHRASQ